MGFRDAVLELFKGMDSRFKDMLTATGVCNWSNNLSLNYNQLYAVALGTNPLELGSLNSVGGVVSSVVSTPAGWLIDGYGVKRMIIAGLTISAVVSVIYGYAVNWVTLMPAVVLAQIGFKMIIPLADLVFVGTSKPESRAQAMGNIRYFSTHDGRSCRYCVRWHKRSRNTPITSFNSSLSRL